MGFICEAPSSSAAAGALSLCQNPAAESRERNEFKVFACEEERADGKGLLMELPQPSDPWLSWLKPEVHRLCVLEFPPIFQHL